MRNALRNKKLIEKKWRRVEESNPDQLSPVSRFPSGRQYHKGCTLLEFFAVAATRCCSLPAGRVMSQSELAPVPH